MVSVTSSPPPERLTDEQWKSRASFAMERDRADRLTGAAKTKFLALRDERDTAHAVRSVPYQRMQDVRARADQVELRISQLTKEGARPYGSDHPLVAAEKEVLERLRAEMRMLSIEHDRRTAASADLVGLVKRTEGYVGSLPLSVALAPAVSPKIAKGETPLQALDRVRERIQALQDEVQAAVDAPVTAAEAKKRMRADVEAMAEAGRPSVANMVDFGEGFDFVTMANTFIGRTVGGEAVTSDSAQFDAKNTLCWLFRDQIIAAIEAEISEYADDVGALTAEQRKKRIAAARKEMLAVEREEEALVCMARESGINVARRMNADPRAILQLADSAPAPRDD